MRSLIFDTGPIISLTLNHLMWTMDFLKQRFDGEFYITRSVKEELIDKPLATKRFKFEALHTLRFLRKGIIKLYEDSDYDKETEELLSLANSIFRAKGNYIQVFHRGEMEVFALARMIKPEAIVIDERASREIVESPLEVERILHSRLHTKIDINHEHLKAFQDKVAGIRVIRSTELAVAAYEMGLLDRYIPDGDYGRETLLDSILWGIKLNGCAISDRDINGIIDLECHK